MACCLLCRSRVSRWHRREVKTYSQQGVVVVVGIFVVVVDVVGVVFIDVAGATVVVDAIGANVVTGAVVVLPLKKGSRP